MVTWFLQFKPLFKRILLASVSLLIALILIELFLRASVRPSETAWGKLFGSDLPPVKMMPVQGQALRDLQGKKTQGSPLVAPEQAPQQDDGTPVKDDLWGICRNDPLLGHAPQENALSTHGWWQTNNVGARSRKNVTSEKDRRKRRIMLFGDSFTNCSRVRQEDTWPYLLERAHNDREVLNFGVDGYSAGQCLLRYRNTASRLQFDAAVFVYVPTDLWRDINICRDLRGWETYTLVPRFVIDGEQLKLIRAPGTGKKFLGKDLDPESMAFVRNYDRFYFPEKFESPHFMGDIVLYKLLMRTRYVRKECVIEKNLLDPDSEAMKVTVRIVKAFAEEAGGKERRFMLFILPTHYELEKYRKEKPFRKRWSAMVDHFLQQGVLLQDLMEGIAAVPAERIDRGFDGTHYGPAANGIIARLVEKGLEKAGLLNEKSSSSQ
jgi:hypothetical protein